jgi:hypothetical protein
VYIYSDFHAALPVGMVEVDFGKTGCSSHVALENPFAAREWLQKLAKQQCKLLAAPQWL